MKRMVSNVKSEKLLQELKDLETRGDDELKERWRGLYGTKPPRKIHRSLLIAANGYRMQENALGGLKPAARRHLLGAPDSRADAMRSTCSVRKRAAGDFVEGRDPVHMGSPIAEKMHFAI